MPSFALVVDSQNVSGRIEGLTAALGPRAGGTSSSELEKKDFSRGSAAFDPRTLTNPKTKLAIDYAPAGNAEETLEFISQIKSVFPEMAFESEFLQQLRSSAQSFKYVRSRGFLSLWREGLFGQDLEFFLTDSQQDDDVVIAEDHLDTSRKQIVFVRTWQQMSAFVEKVLEPWLVSGKVKPIQDFGETAVPFFTGPTSHALSESRQRWLSLPVPSMIYSRAWAEQKPDYPNKDWAIISSKRTYANLHHAFAVLLERSQERIRFGCIFCLPENRGRVVDVHVDPNETNYKLIVQCETTVPLKLKVSCLQDSNVTEVYNADASATQAFAVDYAPTEVIAELLGPDLVDRSAYHNRAGAITTSIQPKPQVVVATQIGLPVQPQVLAGAETMIAAYARFFIMENTLRALAKDRFVKAFGVRWAKELAPVLIAGKTPGEQARVNQVLVSNPDQILEQVYYRDLNRIVDKFWSLFEPLFHDKDRTLLKLKELENLRNDIAHNRVLANHDIKRIEVYYMDLLSNVP
ncbi:MAG: Swt1 family HEPN domain-containing protein [Candidatus Bathyarchaeia archaeon]